MTAAKIRIDVGILGATGMVGQQFIALLASHPCFASRGSARASGRRARRIRDAAAWRLAVPLSDAVARMEVEGDAATRTQARLLRAWFLWRRARSKPRSPGPAHVVVSLIPGITEMEATVTDDSGSADHLQLLPLQSASHGWKGGSSPIQKCAAVVLAMALAPLRRVRVEDRNGDHAAGNLRRCYPGVASWTSGQYHSLHRRRRGGEGRD